MSQIDDAALEKDLRELIGGIIEISPESVTLEANFVDDLGMDSMMALEIIACIEKKYKIRIPEEKLAKLSNLKEAINLTKEYL
jgi:acyl carrier protein